MKIQRLLVGLALLLVSGLLHAQEAAPPPEASARFLIERITVEGTKAAAANIIRAESLLREGGSYSEDQLRQAIYKIHRLPFVLDASFSLRKGSQRGAYELVIEVQPAQWFFFDHWLRYSRFDEPLDLEESITTNMGSSFVAGGLAGARLFVGRSGVLFAALDSEEGVQAGFTQYDLFHKGILASAGISRDDCCVREILPLTLDPTFSFWSFGRSQKTSLSLVVPLGGRQSIQGVVSERRGDAANRQEVLVGSRRQNLYLYNGDLTYRRAEAKWVYDTSDDPLLPTRGVVMSAGLEASRFSGRGLEAFQSSPGSFEAVPVHLPSFSSEQVVAALSGIRHWSVTPRQTVSASGRVSAGRSDVDGLVSQSGRVLGRFDVDSYGASAGVQHAVNLRRTRRVGDLMDVRLESGLEVGVERTTPDVGPSPLERFSASVGLVFRNKWGRIRATLSYLDLGEVFR
ncbi:MAG: POTRA domain-containing protein [Thermoanaerobaculia bacterium]